MGLKLRMLIDLDYLNGMPFTASQISHWFSNYTLVKIAMLSRRLFHIQIQLRHR